MIVQLCFGQSTPYGDKEDKTLQVMDISAENNKLSKLNVNFNFYDIIKDTINKKTDTERYSGLQVCLTGDGSKSLEDFIDKDEELKKSLVNLRKQIQETKNDNLCKHLFQSSYPKYGNEAREIKRHLTDIIKVVFERHLIDDMKQNIDNIDFVGFKTDIKYTRKEYLKYDEETKEHIGTGLYHTTKYMYVYPDIDYPDEKTKEIISKTIDKIQNRMNEFLKDKNNLIEKEDEIIEFEM